MPILCFLRGEDGLGLEFKKKSRGVMHYLDKFSGKKMIISTDPQDRFHMLLLRNRRILFNIFWSDILPEMGLKYKTLKIVL